MLQHNGAAPNVQSADPFLPEDTKESPAGCQSLTFQRLSAHSAMDLSIAAEEQEEWNTKLADESDQMSAAEPCPSRAGSTTPKRSCPCRGPAAWRPRRCSRGSTRVKDPSRTASRRLQLQSLRLSLRQPWASCTALVKLGSTAQSLASWRPGVQWSQEDDKRLLRLVRYIWSTSRCVWLASSAMTSQSAS